MARKDAAAIGDALVAAGLAINGVSVSREGVVTIGWVNGLTTSQQSAPDQATAAGVLARPDYVRKVRRPLYMIFQDLQALPGPQKTAVWTNLSSGTPPKFLLNTGPNAAAIGSLYWSVSFSGAAGNPLLMAQLLLTAQYVQDNPRYLVNPAFSPAINVPGDIPDPVG